MSDTPKTVAESAYCELLAMPLPRTLLDFRRAIVQAALIGQVLQSEMAAASVPAHQWQTSPPTETGGWEISCFETGYEPQGMTVMQMHGELYVDDPAVGSYPLTRYHEQLADLRWRKARTVEAVSPTGEADFQQQQNQQTKQAQTPE